MKNQLSSRFVGSVALVASIAAPAWAFAQAAVESGQPSASDASAGPTAEQAGYAYGVNFGEQLNRLGITTEIPIESLAQGLKDGMSGKKKTTGTDSQVVMQYVRELSARNYARNTAAAQQYLDRNAALKGVKKTSTGLQYKILAAGDVKAASPKPLDAVKVRYSGTLLDGTEFDSTRGEV